MEGPPCQIKKHQTGEHPHTHGGCPRPSCARALAPEGRQRVNTPWFSYREMALWFMKFEDFASAADGRQTFPLGISQNSQNANTNNNTNMLDSNTNSSIATSSSHDATTLLVILLTCLVDHLLIADRSCSHCVVLHARVANSGGAQRQVQPILSGSPSSEHRF